jgi:alkylated DNA nucleotide flippase Atl1/ribonuclease BN (tRNA processing enzyme)
MGKSTLYSRIYEIVNHIPQGKVATYGQIASLAGMPGHARQVGYALHALPDGSEVPWHRVINRKGQISLRSNLSATSLQRALLKSEGIMFDANEAIALEKYQWHVPFGRFDPSTDRDASPAAARDVRIRFLGSGDNFGSGGRFQACIHVDAGAIRFLLDCGASSLIPMKRARISSAAIDVILISHLHGDHFGGIPFFIIDAQLISRREAPLIIAGPPGLKQRIREAMEVFYPGSSQVERKFIIDYVELTEGEITPLGDLTVLPVRVVHGSGAPAYAYRIGCAGKIIAYSGDTEWTDALMTVADEADLFICESYFFEKQMKNHLNYRTLMAHRAELGCKRLILTHLGEDLLARQGEVELEVAHDGLEVLL